MTLTETEFHKPFSRIAIPLMMREKPTVEKNLGLVRKQAFRFKKRNQRVEDTEQYSDGLIGLWYAVENFEPATCEFSTYATECIWNAIANGFRQRNRLKHRFETIPGPELDVFSDKKLVFFPIEILDEFLAIHPEDSKSDQRNKKILKSHFIDGITWAEIGRRMGFTRAFAARCGKDAIEYIRSRYAKEIAAIEDIHVVKCFT